MDIQDIIDSVDIVEYISQYIDLEKQGKELFGLSPFTDEKTPSFSITPDKQLFYDFSFHKGGNVLDFIMLYHKCNFKNAIGILKKYANITENYTDTRLNTTKIIKKYKPRSKKIKNFKHIVLDKTIMMNYEFDKDKLVDWYNEGISYEVMQKYQVRYDPFSNRIVFPVRDLNGTIINVKGRTLDTDYKEKKLRKYTHFYELGQNDFIFGYYEHLDQYLNRKEIILFEGEKSVMKAEGWGVLNTGAIGTSHLDPLQLKILIKLGVRVVFALDKGVNIRNDENIIKLSRYVRVEYIQDDYKDGLLEDKNAPVDKGKDVWDMLYERRKSFN